MAHNWLTKLDYHPNQTAILSTMLIFTLRLLLSLLYNQVVFLTYFIKRFQVGFLSIFLLSTLLFAILFETIQPTIDRLSPQTFQENLGGESTLSANQLDITIQRWKILQSLQPNSKVVVNQLNELENTLDSFNKN